MKKAVISLISVLLLTACTKGSFELSPNDVPQQIPDQTTRTFFEKVRTFALADYSSFMKERGDSTDESLGIESLEPITVELETSRSDAPVKDTVAYIVNFQNTNGSIIITGSRAVPLTTVAIMEESKMRLIDTVQNKGLAMFINMATNYYYQLAGQKVIDAGMATAQEMANKTRTEIHQLVTELALQEDEDEVIIGPYSIDPNATTSTPWTITKREIMIPVKWGQGAPFNNAAPPASSGPNGHALIGCVAVAIGQITTYHQFPKFLDQRPLDWTALTKANSDNYTNQDIIAISEYLARVGSLAGNCWGGTSTKSTDKKARKAFKRLGYNRVFPIMKYHPSLVDQSLTDKMPVYMGGYEHTFDLWLISIPYEGHAWVIDGVLEREKTYTYYNYDGQIVQVVPSKASYFHCNWGWYGMHNGFFFKEIFNAAAGPVFNDTGTGQTPNWSNTSLWYTYDLTVIPNIHP